MRLSRTPAITLRRYDYSETSQVVRLYSREHGKLHCIAKGAKRAKGAFAGAFDVLVLCDVIRLEKQPGALDLLTQAETINEFRGMRGDFGRFSAGCYLADLVEQLTPDAQPQPELFDLLKAALERLDLGAPVAATALGAEAGALRILGYEPRTGECGLCRSRLSGPEAWFSPRDGGAACLRCTPRDPERALFKRPVFDAVAALSAGRSFNLGILPSLVLDVRRLLDLHLRGILGHELKTARFFREGLRTRDEGRKREAVPSP